MKILFNVSNGFVDAILRGYFSGLVSRHQYLNLIQCESLDDLRVQLGSSDYGEYLQSLGLPTSTSVLRKRLCESFIHQFKYLASNAEGDLSKFLGYISLEYMIDNVILIIAGMLHSANMDELLDECHPLGVFESMPALVVAQNVEELYNTVLIETPLAPYFKECLAAKDLNDINVELIRNTLYRSYLEDFYRFVSTLDDTTAETMSELLALEADRRTLNIAINSIGTEINKEARMRLVPTFGKLYSTKTSERITRTDDIEHIKSCLETHCPEYASIISTSSKAVPDKPQQLQNNETGENSLEEFFSTKQIELCRMAFQQQFCYTPFFAYVKLKEQEIRNIVWIAECISQKQKDRVNRYIPTV